MAKAWTCRVCGRTNDYADRANFCGACLAGRTQAIENAQADFWRIPRRQLPSPTTRRFTS